MKAYSFFFAVFCVLICLGILPGGEAPFFDLKTVSLLILGAVSAWQARSGIVWGSTTPALLAGALILNYVFVQLHNRLPLVTFESLQWLAFGAIASAVVFIGRQKEGALRESFAWAVAVSCAVSLAVFAAQLFSGNESTGSVFGGPNLFSEFSGAAVIILLFSRLPRAKYVLIASSLGAIIYCNSRAVLVSLAAVCVLNLLVSRVQAPKKALGFVVALVLVVAAVWGVGARPEYRALKPSSNSMRWARFLNTSKMIAENPLGLGVDQYQFRYLKYAAAVLPDTEVSRQNVMKTPHNIVQECALSYGLVSFVLVCALLLYYLRRLPLRLPKLRLPLSGIFYVLCVGLTQFPFSFPPSFFFLAVFVGFALREAKVAAKSKPSPLLARVALGAILLFGAVSVYGLQARAVSNEKLCRSWIWSWQACLDYAVELKKQGRAEESLKTIDAVLARQPENFVAERLRAEIALNLRF